MENRIRNMLSIMIKYYWFTSNSRKVSSTRLAAIVEDRRVVAVIRACRNGHGAVVATNGYSWMISGTRSLLIVTNCTTIIFQTVWHFASASRLKCSHDDVQTDSDWIFKINEICIWNGKPTNTLTNRIQSAFGVYFFKILQNTWTVW